VVTVGVIALTFAPRVAAQQHIDHAEWDRLLQRYVTSGLVDYEGLKRERETLDRYLANLETVDPARLPSREAKLAFWINAYNATVVKDVLDHYPLKSVRKVKGFFNRIRHRVAGGDLTLDEIEKRGRALGDYRIHFAVVCASTSCPILRSEAYVPERLEEQLADQTTQFVNDPQRGLRLEGSTLWASKIFKWYTDDFLPESKSTFFSRLAPEALLVALEPYPDMKLSQAGRDRKMKLRFMNYDWSLNKQ